MSGLEALAIVAVGTLCGIDLVSVPQIMIARPLAAAFLGGLVVGAPLPALAVGALLELLAMETLPVGAVRYPDWGPPSAAAGALVGVSPASASPSGLLAVLLVAIGAAWLGGWLMHLTRRAAGAHAMRLRAALDAGDVRALGRLQWAGLGRDAARSFLIAAVSLTGGDALSVWFTRGWQGPEALAQIAVVAATVGVAVWSAWRLFGHGRVAWWLAGGVTAGAALAVAVR